MYTRRINLFKKMPQLDGKRIYLRKLSVSDASDMYEYSKDPEVTKYLLWEEHSSLSMTGIYLLSLQKDYLKGRHSEWAIIYKPDNKMIGTVGFTRIDSENSIGEIGYVLSRAYWGLGIAKEAAQILLSVGFDYLGLERIEIKYMAENLASKRVGEKLGMKYEGTLRKYMFVKGIFRDISISSILSEEYRKNHEKKDYSYLDGYSLKSRI